MANTCNLKCIDTLSPSDNWNLTRVEKMTDIQLYLLIADEQKSMVKRNEMF